MWAVQLVMQSVCTRKQQGERETHALSIGAAAMMHTSDQHALAGGRGQGAQYACHML